MSFILLVLIPELLALVALGLAVLVHRLLARRAEKRLLPAPRRWPVRLAWAGVYLTLPLTLVVFWPATRACWHGCGWDGRYERLTRNAEIVSAESASLGTLRRPPVVPVAELPPAVVQAFVVTEDARFERRRLGIDLRGSARSLFHDALRRPIQGAFGHASPLNGGSTIEMQTIRLLPGDPFHVAGRTLRNKLNEMLLAVDLRLNLERPRILTLYLNLLPGPDGSVGIESLAERAFSCRAQDLSLAMAATLAGANRSPVRLSPRVSPPDAYAERTRVLRQIADRRPELAEEVRRAEAAPPGPRCRSIARPPGDPWVMYALRDQVPAPDSVRLVRTTIARDVQVSAQRAVDDLVRGVERGRFGRFVAVPGDPLQAALVILRPDGTVAAGVCGRRDKLVNRAYDRCAQGRFECGSVCKTFSFAAGVELGLFDETTLTEDLREGPGMYCDTSSWGRGLERIDAPTVGDVLTWSSNYGGCLMYRQLSEAALARVRALGIPFSADRPANAIGGGIYPSLLTLTAAFATFGDGVLRQPRYLATSPGRRAGTVVWSAGTLEHLRLALEPVVRVGTAAGTVAPLLEPGDTLLSKTGTSSESESLVYCAILLETRMTGCIWLGRDRTRRTLVPGLHAGGIAGSLAGVLLEDARRRRATPPVPAHTVAFEAATGNEP